MFCASRADNNVGLRNIRSGHRKASVTGNDGPLVAMTRRRNVIVIADEGQNWRKGLSLRMVVVKIGDANHKPLLKMLTVDSLRWIAPI
jgi:hypothetical protein